MKMSLAKIEEEFCDVAAGSAAKGGSFTEVVQCCDRHILVNPRITVNDGDNISFIDIQDLNTSLELQQLRTILMEKNHLVSSLEKEKTFLKEQVTVLNALLDQLSTSMRNLATQNNIRIHVENSTNMTVKKWYKRPKLVLSASAIALLCSIYLKYKINHW